MNKRNITIISICFIIIITGIILNCTIGANFNLEYNNHTEIDVYIGQEFDNKEIKDLSQEVLQSNEIDVKKVEIYKDMACIMTKNDISTEQIESLNQKINEKYELENEVENITITKVPKIEMHDLIKPYLAPIIISLIIILIYTGIYLYVMKKKGKDINITKVLVKFLLITIGIPLLCFSLIIITRLPINKVTIPVLAGIYILSVFEETYSALKKKI